MTPLPPPPPPPAPSAGPVFLTLRAPRELRAALDALAAARGTTRHRAALEALRAYLDAHPAPARPGPVRATPDALAAGEA